MHRSLALAVRLLAVALQLAATLLPIGLLANVLPDVILPTALPDHLVLPTAIALAIIAALIGGFIVAPALWRHSQWWLAPILLPMLWQAAFWTSAATLPIEVTLVGHAAIGMGLGTLLGEIGLSVLPPDTFRTGAMAGLSGFGTLTRIVWPAARRQTMLAVLLALLALVPEHWGTLHSTFVSLPVHLHAML